MKSITQGSLIRQRIIVIRGRKIMLDRDLAYLYGVKPIALRQQVKRNINRFPGDFMFKLTNHEAAMLVSQNVIPTIKQLGGWLPYAFSEQGIAMLSSVLKSNRAVHVNIQIMRAFIKVKTELFGNEILKKKITALEQKYDKKFRIVFVAIRNLLKKPSKPIEVEVIS